MKKYFGKLYLGGVLLISLSMSLTSCEDILGEWSRPTPGNNTPSGGGGGSSSISVTSITLNKTTASLSIGDTETLTVTDVSPADATDKTYTWSSDKTAVATVDANGVVTAVAVGTAIISATANDGSGIEGTCTVSVTTTGLLTGDFSVAADKKVRFSKGNLQATTTDGGGTWTWAFATNQYDRIGNAAANNAVNGLGTVSADGTVDLFGWVGASNTSWGGGAQYGISDTKTVGSATDFGTTAGESLKADWGTTMGTGWRTLTSAEWDWLLCPYSANPGTNCRTSSTVNGTDNARFAKAKLFNSGAGGVNGIIIFPDSYTHPEGVDQPTGINVTGSASYSANNYSAADWAKMEAAGAVFLPTTGKWANGGSSGWIVMNLENGYYWSATSNSSDAEKATLFQFRQSDITSQYNGESRCNRCSVRLVYDVK